MFFLNLWCGSCRGAGVFRRQVQGTPGARLPPSCVQWLAPDTRHEPRLAPTLSFSPVFADAAAWCGGWQKMRG